MPDLKNRTAPAVLKGSGISLQSFALYPILSNAEISFSSFCLSFTEYTKLSFYFITAFNIFCIIERTYQKPLY